MLVIRNIQTEYFIVSETNYFIALYVFFISFYNFNKIYLWYKKITICFLEIVYLFKNNEFLMFCLKISTQKA